MEEASPSIEDGNKKKKEKFFWVLLQEKLVPNVHIYTYQPTFLPLFISAPRCIDGYRNAWRLLHSILSDVEIFFLSAALLSFAPRESCAARLFKYNAQI